MRLAWKTRREGDVRQKTEAITGGQAMVASLRQHGLNTVFCLAGAAHAPLLRDLETAGFHIVSSRHETGTVAAADGYARVTGRVGVAMIAGFQGLPNAIAGIRTAQLACSPVVVLISTSDGQSESMDEDTNDLLDMVKPFVKWAKTAPSAARLEEISECGVAPGGGRPTRRRGSRRADKFRGRDPELGAALPLGKASPR